MSSQVEAIAARVKVLLAQQLGRFENNAIAVWIEPPHAPATKARSGLQVIFNRIPTPKAPPSVAGAQIDRWMSVEFTLTQFDSTVEGVEAMNKAIEILKANFPLIEVVPLPLKEGYLPKASCSIPYHEITNLSTQFIA